MSKIKVDKIVLKIGKKREIELSLEEAEELQKVLADLLGITTCTTTTGYYEFLPNPVPTPYKIWKINPWTPYEGSITEGTIAVSNTITDGSAS